MIDTSSGSIVTPSGEAGACFLVVPHMRRGSGGLPGENGAGGRREPQARLEEAAGLARAIGLDIARADLAPLSRVRPSTLLGEGKLEEIRAFIEENPVSVVIVDAALTPVQQRNLERALKTKVLDRTGLILEIFGARANTREGALQVELAHLTYQKSRLVRSWTHLERQRGGFGFLGGPGETQIEADRRMLQERISMIERDLRDVTRTRGLHRTARAKVPHAVVALVGYTNAGKSTLFNRLTHAEVLEADMLFATLDPTLRAITLPGGRKIILSDTVGFISQLPTQLVAAFRATLEEVLSADLVLHVRDISHADTEAQSDDVARVLRELGLDPTDHAQILEVWNKVDALDDDARDALEATAARMPDKARPVLISALTGQGMDTLLDVIEARLNEAYITLTLAIPATDGAGLAWLHEHGTVLESTSDADTGTTAITVRLPPVRAVQAQARFGQG